MSYLGSIAARLAGSRSVDEAWTRFITAAGEDFWALMSDAKIVGTIIGSRVAETMAPSVGKAAGRVARGVVGRESADLVGSVVEGALRGLAGSLGKRHKTR